MNASNQLITVNDLKVRIVRKDIKHMHLSVRPPDGWVRVSVPYHVDDDNVRLAVISKLHWIRKQQARLDARPAPSSRKLVTGESHYLFGERYLLEVVERYGRHDVSIRNNTILVMYVKPGTSERSRALVMNEWYRNRLKEKIPALLDKWQPMIGKEVKEWGIKRMKTRWGTCNTSAKRIWLNLELARNPVECLEYVVVHEMVHLLERSHNKRFIALMDKFLPEWRLHRDSLNSVPLTWNEG